MKAMASASLFASRSKLRMRNLDAGSSGTSRGSSGTSKGSSGTNKYPSGMDTSDTKVPVAGQRSSISGTKIWERSSSYKRERRQKTV